MPDITDSPPPAVARDIAALRAHLDQRVPPKQPGQNLLIATWNLRAFASLTREWTASAKASPKRDLRALPPTSE